MLVHSRGVAPAVRANPRPRYGMRKALLIVGLALILSAVVLPRDWYDRLPRDPALPLPPISGVTLLQISPVAEGLVLVWLSRRSRAPEVRPRPGALRCRRRAKGTRRSAGAQPS